jgi:hypothetical protein
MKDLYKFKYKIFHTAWAPSKVEKFYTSSQGYTFVDAIENFMNEVTEKLEPDPYKRENCLTVKLISVELMGQVGEV